MTRSGGEERSRDDSREEAGAKQLTRGRRTYGSKSNGGNESRGGRSWERGGRRSSEANTSEKIKLKKLTRYSSVRLVRGTWSRSDGELQVEMPRLPFNQSCDRAAASFLGGVHREEY